MIKWDYNILKNIDIKRKLKDLSMKEKNMKIELKGKVNQREKLKRETHL